MSAANADIRAAANRAGVYLYNIAYRLGISENTMTRRLRRELSDEEKAKIKGIIAELADEKANEKTA